MNKSSADTFPEESARARRSASGVGESHLLQESMKRMLTFQLTDGAKVRVHCIEAPELNQPGGNQSQTALAKMVSGQNVRFEMKGVDRQGRVSAEVAIGDTPANLRMLETGQAWRYEEY